MYIEKFNSLVFSVLIFDRNVFSCLPVGTGRVVSVLIVYINKNFCLTLYFHVFP